MDMGRGEERVRFMERVTRKLTRQYVKRAVWLRKLKQGLSINLEEWDGREMGGRFKREGIYVYQ